MAKIRDKNIEIEDIKNYVEKVSDFNFEMKVKNSIPKNYNVEHAGSYIDPVTNKYREFDFRLTHYTQAPFHTYFKIALEAKNIQNNSPVLVSCLPRSKEEAFHEVITSKNEINKLGSGYQHAYMNRILSHSNLVYRNDAMVGKSFTQIAKNYANDFLNTDAEIYEKWSQAINSCNDLIVESITIAEHRRFDGLHISLVLPVCVIPEGTLWIVDYSDKGEIISEPKQTNHISVFTGTPIHYDRLTKYVISHMHFVTINYIKEFLESIIDTSDFIPVERLRVN